MVYADISKIVIVGVLTYRELLHSVSHLKAAQMDVKCCLIQKIILYEFDLGQIDAEATRNTCLGKGEYPVNHMLTRWFKGFCLHHRNFDDQARSARPETVNSKSLGANPARRTRRV